MQTGYFVHKVLVICKLLKLTWSCCLLPSTKCTWKTWDCWKTPFQARHVPQLPTPGGLVSPDQNIKHFCHCCFCSVSCCCWLFVYFFFAILDVVVSDIDVDLIFLATFIVLPQLPTSGGLTWTKHQAFLPLLFLLCFLLLLLTFCYFRCGIFGTTMWLLLLLFWLFLPLVIVLLLPQVSRPGGSSRPELRAWLLWRLQVKRPIHGHPVRISAICRV